MTGERLLAQQAGARFRQGIQGPLLARGVSKRQTSGCCCQGTFMNASGESVERAARRGRVEVSDIVVVYDDMDLEFGLLRIRSGGSSGGHLGVKSIIEEFNSPRFRSSPNGHRKAPGASYARGLPSRRFLSIRISTR